MGEGQKYVSLWGGISDGTFWPLKSQLFLGSRDFLGESLNPLVPLWAQPVRLVPPGEALSLAVENENTQEFFILYGWSLFYG